MGGQWMVRVAEEEFCAEWRGPGGSHIVFSVDGDGASYALKRAGGEAFEPGAHLFEADPIAALAEIRGVITDAGRRALEEGEGKTNAE